MSTLETVSAMSDSNLRLSRRRPTLLRPRATMRHNRHNRPTRAGSELPQPGCKTISSVSIPPTAASASIAITP